MCALWDKVLKICLFDVVGFMNSWIFELQWWKCIVRLFRWERVEGTMRWMDGLYALLAENVELDTRIHVIVKSVQDISRGLFLYV